MKQSHQPGDLIAERYRILAILGQGGTGTTYEAQELNCFLEQLRSWLSSLVIGHFQGVQFNWSCVSWV